jgi:ribose/xylose/arabinose/galactoside ABC-type transport system permease subunit
MNFAMDQNGDGVINFKDLWAFLTQKVFGFPLYMLLAIGGGVAYYMGWFGKKRRYGRR